MANGIKYILWEYYAMKNKFGKYDKTKKSGKK